MMVATDWRAAGFDRCPVAAAASISGVHDLRLLTRASMNADLKLDLAEAARLSPALLAPVSDTPLLLAVGGDETPEFLRQTALMHDAWPRQRPRDVARTDRRAGHESLQRRARTGFARTPRSRARWGRCWRAEAPAVRRLGASWDVDN